MRNAMLAILALLAARLPRWPALRRPRRMIIPGASQGRGVGFPGDCSYSHAMGNAMASASGRGLYCNVNPRVAFERQRARPYRRHRDCRPGLSGMYSGSSSD